MTGIEGPGDANIGGIAQRIDAELENIGSVQGNAEAYDDIAAHKRAAEEAMQTALGELTALAAILDTRILDPVHQEQLDTLAATNVFRKIGEGSSQPGIALAARHTEEANFHACKEDDHACHIAAKVEVSRNVLSQVLANMAFAGSLKKARQASEEKVGHRDRAVQGANDYKNTL